VAVDLQEAERYVESSKESEIYKGYRIYKSLYIRSLVKDVGRERRIEILRGIIKAAKKLKLPYKKYESELYQLIGDRKVEKRGKKGEVELKRARPKREKRLTRVILRKGYVEFHFDRPLSSRDITFRRINSKGRYQNIYQIRGRILHPKSYSLKSVRRLRVVQYTKDSLRIIFENDRPFKTKKRIEGKRLLVYLNPSQKERGGDPPPAVKVTTPQSLLSSPGRGKTIVIDPGHGGRDSGAIGYKRKREKDIVLSIAKKLYRELKRRGYRVYMTRKGDYFVKLRNRTRFANRMKAHLFISIHANAAPSRRKYLSMKGIETFFLSPTRSERAKRVAELENKVDIENLSYFSKQVYLDFLNRERIIFSNKLAIDIQRGILHNLRKRYRVVDGGVRPGPFWVLVGAQMPAVLVEVGYITNPTEARRLANPYYQKLIAKGIADGIASYFIHNQK